MFNKLLKEEMFQPENRNICNVIELKLSLEKLVKL